MRRISASHARVRSVAAELSDPALAHLFGPGTATLVAEPASPTPPAADPAGTPASRWLAWTLPARILEADETLLRLEDGGFFEIREVPREAPDDLDFEVFVEFEAEPLMNLDDYPVEFEADLAVFEGISGTKKGGPVEPSRPACLRELVGAAGLEPATPAV